MRSLLLVMLVLSVSACSVFQDRPLYMEKEGQRPHGYTQIAMGENRYQITYETYEKISMQEAEQLALRRAAELSVENGHSGFDVDDKICFNDYVIEESAEIAPAQRTATFASDAGPISVPIDEPYFPSVTHTYEIKKCVLKIRLLDEL